MAPGSPAADAGIEVGDIVVVVDDAAVDGQAALIAAIRDRAPGDDVEIVVQRGDERLTLSAVLASRPEG